MNNEGNEACNTLLLSLGSNTAERDRMVKKAISWISESCMLLCCSDVYSTPEYSGGDRIYSNAVAEIQTHISVEDFNKLLKEYEISCGRDDEARERGDVPIDIDIVCVNDRIIRNRDYQCDFFKIGLLQIRNAP